MTDDLKSRLRSVGGVRHDGATRWYINPDGPEAADYIEKLELVEKAYQQNQQTWSRNIARVEKLEAALRVYADEDHWFGDKFEPIMFPEGECKCCYEHFSDQGEIARKALEGKDD